MIQNSTFKIQHFSRVILLLLLFPLAGKSQYDADRYPIIPKPYALLPFSGEFNLTASTVLITDNKFYRNEIEYFRKEVKQYCNIDLKYASKKVDGDFIYISEDSTDIPNEGYNLFINRNEINIYGGHAGIFYALQTLFQLISSSQVIVYDKDSNIVDIPGEVRRAPHKYIPSCSIVDQPRFQWRGMHLDVSRHFFPKDSVKCFLRYMALYKFNTFHWHLTDDQGWRIEIKKYPKLTSVGAWRDGTLIGHEGETIPRYDSTHYGGFYTQADIREIIRFADSLHITIVPEIEMPGHSLAMLAAYPELGCTPGPFAVSKTWGVFDDVLCPTEKTFSFLDDVLKEVCALFPGKYIHIGGDECPKARWKSSEFCQNLMKQNNLKDENELQSWFTQRIVKMLEQKGKEAIGWDEILEGGLADGAAVMSWRGEDGGIAAAKAKHNVVMSPGSNCYFDHYQSQNPGEPLAIGGYLPLEKVYSYNPVPQSLNADERKYILGVQANVWTEYIPTFSQVQYMIFPRMAAMSEVAWDEPINMNYDFFLKRLIPHLNFLDEMKINYAKSIFEIHGRVSNNNNGSLNLELYSSIPDSKIEYYYNTTDKVQIAYTYTKPLLISESTNLSGHLAGNKDYSRDYVFKSTFNLATGRPVLLRKQPSPSYNTGGPLTLVDGIEGRQSPWVGSQWLGFLGDTADVTIDLQKDTTISRVEISYLDDNGSWVYGPHNVIILTSEDGLTFKEAEMSTKVPTPDEKGKIFIPIHVTKARYVKVIVTPVLKIPEGNPGEGKPAWLFLSEVEIF